MNDATKDALSKAYGINYDSLPARPPAAPKKGYMARVFSVIATMTVIGPVAMLSLKLLVIRSPQLFFKEKSITPFAEERLKEVEKNVQNMAATVGIKHPNKIKVVLTKQNIGGVAAAAGKKLVMVAPEFLLRPEDLPEELKLSRLDKGEITEQEWILKFAKWRDSKAFTSGGNRPNSQAEVDGILAYSKSVLHQMRNPKDRNQMHAAVLAHELGHCKKNHSRQKALATFGWDLLALPTLGISMLFEKKVMNKFSRKQEKEADMISLKANRSGDGLIKFFDDILVAGQTLHTKYPKRYDAQGNNIGDHGHPKLTKRVAYLTAASAA